MNLVTNAIEAIRGDQGRITVRIDRRDFSAEQLLNVYYSEHLQPGTFAVLVVKDNGSGMSRDSVERVLDPFFTTKLSGRGLGMATVSGIVLRHGGAIQVTSTLDVGTTITVLLPLFTAQIEPAMQIPAEPETVPTDHRRLKILLVEDEVSVRNVIETALASQGHDVTSISTGEKAIRLLCENRMEFDLLVADCTLPTLSGPATYRMLLKNDVDLPVLFVSGYSADHVRGLIDEQWTAGCLIKPFALGQLYEAVARLVDVADR